MKKNKTSKLYLLTSDIEALNSKYEKLYRQVKDNPYLSAPQIERECEILLAKYNFEIDELSQFRETDYLKKQAEINAKNREQKPVRRCWLWRLLFVPLTNRAQDIIEESARLDAEELFTPEERQLDVRYNKLLDKKLENVGELKKRRYLKTLNKYKKYRQQLDEIIQAADYAPPSEVFAEPAEPSGNAGEAPPEPKKRGRPKASTQLPGQLQIR